MFTRDPNPRPLPATFRHTFHSDSLDIKKTERDALLCLCLLLITSSSEVSLFKRLSLKQGTENRGIGMGNGERGTGNGERGTGNGERGIFKMGNL